tara:strand:+ start:163 stop:327 length:165 start_codon:yes stop_codon:yes gene_type:complete
MKRLLLLLIATLTLPTATYAHPNYEGLGIKKQYGFKTIYSNKKEGFVFKEIKDN